MLRKISVEIVITQNLRVRTRGGSSAVASLKSLGSIPVSWCCQRQTTMPSYDVVKSRRKEHKQRVNLPGSSCSVWLIVSMACSAACVALKLPTGVARTYHFSANDRRGSNLLSFTTEPAFCTHAGQHQRLCCPWSAPGLAQFQQADVAESLEVNARTGLVEERGWLDWEGKGRLWVREPQPRPQWYVLWASLYERPSSCLFLHACTY